MPEASFRDLERQFDRAFRESSTSIDKTNIALPRTVAEAESVQDALWRAHDSNMTGWKLGATNWSSRAALALEEPFAGRVKADRVLRSGGSISVAGSATVGGEGELAAIFAFDCPVADAPYTAPTVLERLKGWAPAIEIPINRIGFSPEMGGAALIADNGAAGWIVVGEAALGPSDAAEHPLQCTLYADDVAIGEGDRTKLIASPLDLLTDHVNRMAARGFSMKAGDVVCTGGLTPFRPVEDRATLRFEIDGCGAAEVQLSVLAD